MVRPLLCALGLLASSVALAQRAPLAPGVDTPRVDAMMASDGTWLLTVYPPLDWVGAEVEVAGAGGVDVGPASHDQPVQVHGWSSKTGPMSVVLRVATPEKVGITWEFEVSPTMVPSRAPELQRVKAEGKKRWWRK